MNRLKLESPAKLNLFLNVLQKRKDGYHNIETLFERISLTDELTLKKIPSGIRIQTNESVLPRGPQNIAYRAAQLLKDKLHVREGVLIRIKKRIPIAAGLGGGSSNAATVLIGLNRLWKLGLSKEKLCQFASQLGSDVPFFILDTPFAVGRGRGEILKKIAAPRVKIWHCLVKPRFSVSTKAAYVALQSSRLTPKKPNAKMLLHSIQQGTASALSGHLTNSLELTLNKRVRTILEIKKKLLAKGAIGSLMSGSGSTVFGIYRSKREAAHAARFLRRNKSWQVFVVSTL